MKREFIEALYFHELGNRDRLDARVPALVAILSVIAGMIYFSIHEFRPIAPWLTRIFLALIGSCALLYVAAIVLIYRGTFGYKYERLPTAGAMHAYHVGLLKYYESNQAAGLGPEEEFDDFLTRHMLKATERNTLANLTRGARYYNAMTLLASCVILALAASGTVLSVERVSSLQARGERRDAMSNEQRPGQSVSPTASGQTSSPAQTESAQPLVQPAKPVEPAIAKPVEPDNIIFKGSQEPSPDTIILRDDTGKGKQPE